MIFNSVKKILVQFPNIAINRHCTLLFIRDKVAVGDLFVDKNHRRKDLGSKLLQHVENEARDFGATLSHLDTFDFQAKDFYLKHGYEIFGTLEDCPPGHERYYLKKKL